MDYTTNESNAEILTVDDPPYPVPAAYTYDNGWIVADQGMIDAYRRSITPQEISNWQAKKQLLIDGVYEQVDAAISTMGVDEQVDWLHAGVFRRDYPLILGMQALLGRTDADTDEYFIAASKLR